MSFLSKIQLIKPHKNNINKNNITDYSIQLKRIRKEIYLSPNLEWNSETLANNLGISNGYFRKIYKSQFKIPFKEDHINARISKAKSLLSDTNLTIVEIALQCGFNNPSHFMRIFKKKSGKFLKNRGKINYLKYRQIF